MANLKGSTFEKQIKNAKIRIEARGQSKYNKQDLNLTHSNALALKRDYYLKSFAEYASSLNLLEPKLNNYLTNDIVKSFLEKKTSSMSLISAINFTRGFSALTTALSEKGISTGMSKETYDSHVKLLKQIKDEKVKVGNRNIENIHEVIRNLHNINPAFAKLALLQSNLSLRVSEGIELLKNGSKYIQQDNIVHNLIGKGSLPYGPKPLSLELQRVLMKRETVNYQSYQNALKTMNITSHDMRYTYVINRMNQLLHTKNYKESLRIISYEINHKREEITEYYLSQTSFI